MKTNLSKLCINRPVFWTYDIEVYPNFFLALFYDGQEFIRFTNENIQDLAQFVKANEKILIGYNNLTYDDHILLNITNGRLKTTEEIYKFSQELINNNYRPTPKEVPWYRSVDIMELCFKRDEYGTASLKELAVRMHWPDTIETPIDFNKPVRKDDIPLIIDYCKNDVLITATLWEKLKKHVQLREELERMFGVNVYTLSATSVTETLFLELYSNRSGIPTEQLRQYKTIRKSLKLKELIPEFVSFENDELQNFLSYLKNLELENKSAKWENSDFTLLKKELSLGGLQLSFGAGGLHSKDEPGIWESTKVYQIIDVDVTSYYPAIMLNLGLYPEHLSPLWSTILKELTAKRIEAKKDDDKLVADALKIVINSAFGRTKFKHSFMYDPKVFLGVTLTGQLALLMLAESLAKANFELLSLNTDGITFIARKGQEYKHLLKTWEETTGFNLEETRYRTYARRAINSYVAVTQEGKVKVKGDFVCGDLFKKGDYPIIAKALCDYFVAGKPVHQTVDESSSLYDFCAYSKARLGWQHLYDDTPQTERVIRYYISISGKKLERAKEGKRIKVSNAESVSLAGAISPDAGLPKDLNKAAYIEQVNKIIREIELGKVVNQLRKQGLYPIPKEYKRNPRGAKLDKIKLSWNWGNYSGIGVYTGLEAETLVIDVDNFDLVPNEILDLLSVVPTMTVWHGENTGELKRFSLVFRCFNRLLKSTPGTFLAKYGFEVLYGNKTAQVFGPYNDRENYTFSGEVAEIPSELEKWLMKHTQTHEPEQIVKQIELDFEKSKSKIQQHQELVGSIEHQEIIDALLEITQEILPNWRYTINQKPRKIKLRGQCPARSEHTSKSSNTDFDVSWSEDRPDQLMVGCFHQSCTGAVAEIRLKLQTAWDTAYQTKIKNQSFEAIPLEIPKSQTTMAQALRNKSAHTLITAPTGAGKTYESALYFLESLKEQKTIVYIASNRTDLAQFSDRIQEISGAKLDDLLVTLLQGGEKIEEELDESDQIKIPQWVRGVITHHTYIKRKGISPLFFSFLGWIEKNNPIVIVDEADQFLESLALHINIGARYRTRNLKHDKYMVYEHLSTCPAFERCGNCDNCGIIHFQKYQSNTYSIPEIQTVYRFDQLEYDTLKNERKLELPEIELGETKWVGRFKFSEIKPHKTHLEQKIYRWVSTEGALSVKEAIADVINTSYNPTMFTNYPQIQGLVVGSDEIRQIDPKDRKPAGVSYPNYPCEISVLCLRDLAPLEWLRRHASKSRWLTATIGPTNREFLRTGLRETKEINIQSSHQKVDDLLIVSFNKKLTLFPKTGPIFRLNKQGKVLVFEPKKSSAQHLYGEVPAGYPAGCYTRNSISVDEKFAEGQWKMLITYPRGPLGRAIRLTRFDIIVLSTLVYRPVYTLNLKDHTEQEIQEQILEDQRAVLVQAGGRFFGQEGGRKVILVHSLEKAQEGLDIVNVMKRAYHNLVMNEIKCTHFEYNINEMLESIYTFLDTGEMVNNEVPLQEVAKEKGLRRIAPNKREAMREKISKSKAKDTWLKLRDAARSFEGKWRDFSNKFHISRLKKSGQLTQEEIQELKNLIS